MKIRNFIRRHWKLMSVGVSVVLVGAILGVSIQPVQTQPIHEKSISSGTKYVITIGEQVLAAGLSADYTCTGTADNVIWASAIAALPAGGGIINDLTGGNYHFVATVNVPTNVTIMGIGSSSNFSGASPCFNVTGNGTLFSNLVVSATGGGITTGSYTYVFNNVTIGSTVYDSSNPVVSAPTGRTDTFTVASLTYGSAKEKAQADFVTDDMVAAYTAARATFPDYTYTVPYSGVVSTGKIGTIVFGAGLYTSASQWIIPAGDDITIICNTSSSYGNPTNVLSGGLPYMGGAQFLFTGTSYPVFEVPQTSGNPATTLNMTNITLVITNPVSPQANTVFAYNLDGWVSGTLDNIYWLSSVAYETYPIATYPRLNANIKGLSIKPGWTHDRLQITSMTVAGFEDYSLVLSATHLYGGTWSIGFNGATASGDNSYAIYSDCDIILDRLNVESPSGGVIYSPSTESQPIIINSLMVEGINPNNQLVGGGGLVRINSLHMSTPNTINSSIFTNASVSWVSYDTEPASFLFGGNINSRQNYGFGGKDYINQLLPILGDVRLLLPMIDSLPSTVVTDYSSYALNGVAHGGNTNAWAKPPLIKGASSVYFMNAANSQCVTVANNALLTFGNGSSDVPFSVIAVVNESSLTSADRIITKTNESSAQEYQLQILPNGTISWGINDQTHGGYLYRNSNAGQITIDTWHIIVGTYDGSGTIGGVKIYDNGIQVDTSSTVGGSYIAMSNQNIPVGIGARGDQAGIADGQQQSWSIITAKCLSSMEVYQITQILKSSLELP